MTEESRVSRTPRTWHASSPEPPAGVDRLRDYVGDILGRDEEGWLYVEIRGRVVPELEREDGVPWDDVDDTYEVAWPLVEVLPDAPEPQPEEWRVNARIEEARATSLGYCETVVEVYPDGEEETCGNLRERGSVHCAEHGAPAPGSYSVVSSVSPEGETTPGEGEGVREALAALISPEAWAAEEADQDTMGAQWRISEGRWLSKSAAARILAAGWRPPQPETRPCKYVVSHFAGLPGSECISSAEPGSDYCKPHGGALKALSRIELRDTEGQP